MADWSGANYREAGGDRRSRWDRSSSSSSSSHGKTSSSQKVQQSHRDRSPPSRHRDRSPIDDRARISSGDADYRGRSRSDIPSSRDIDDRPRRRRFTEGAAASEREPETSPSSTTTSSSASRNRFSEQQQLHSRFGDSETERLPREESEASERDSVDSDPSPVSYGIPHISQYDDIDDRERPAGDQLDGEPMPQSASSTSTSSFSGFGTFSKEDLNKPVGDAFGIKKAVAPIKMSLGAQKPKAPPAIKKTPAVANVFGEDDDSEEEEMPAAAKMRMRNIGRDTPTAAGPNSFGKGRLGFCDRQKIIQREIQKKIDYVPKSKKY